MKIVMFYFDAAGNSTLEFLFFFFRFQDALGVILLNVDFQQKNEC